MTIPPDRSTNPAQPHARSPSLRARILLLLATLGAIAIATELGFRIYYAVTDAPLTEVYQGDEKLWQQRWIAQHQNHPDRHFQGSDQYHPLYGWKPVPDLDKAVFDGMPPISTNSRGWRNLRDYDFDKPAGIRRIVVLGDSFTFGEQEQDEHIWPAVLEDALRDCQVVNLAVHGHGTDQQLLVLREEGLRYQPDVVVLGFFVHNVFRNVLRFRDYAKPRFELNDGELHLSGVPVPTPEQVLEQGEYRKPASYALHWMTHRVRRAAERVQNERFTDEMMDVTRALLADMNRLCTEHDAKLLVAIIPNPPKPAPQVEQAVLDWSGKDGYQALPLRQPLLAAEQRDGKPTYYLHFSRLGHVVTAQEVAAKLRRLGWLDPEQFATADVLEQRYQQALQAEPIDAESKRHYAAHLASRGKVDQAITYYQQALDADTDRPIEVHHNLANLFRIKGQLNQAILHLERVAASPDASPKIIAELAVLLVKTARDRRAVEVLRKGRTRFADSPLLINHLAWILSTSPDDSVRDGDEAMRLIEQLPMPDAAENPTYLDTMAAAHAEAEQFDRAVELAQRAIQQATKAGLDPTHREAMKARLEAYKRSQPYRDNKTPPQS